MHAVEKALRKSCSKIAKWYPDKCALTLMPDGFLLKMHGDSQFTPTIGVIKDDVIGAMDDYDMFLDMIGWECQAERVLFHPERKRFVLDAGWGAKLWRKPEQETQKTLTATEEGEHDFMVDAIASRMPTKLAATVLALIVAQQRESTRRIKRALNPFKK